MEFDKKAKAIITAIRTTNFGDESKPEKPVLDIEISGQEFSFVLNKTNQAFIGAELKKHNLEDDTDNIPIGATMTIEAYDTKGSGQYRWGLKITEFTFPTEQAKLAPTPKPKK